MLFYIYIFFGNTMIYNTYFFILISTQVQKMYLFYQANNENILKGKTEYLMIIDIMKIS